MLSKQLERQKQGFSDSDVAKKVLDAQIEQEKNKLRLAGAKKLSATYLDLIDQRRKLDSSPRGIGSFPSSPVKGLQHDERLDFEKRRSPTNMRLNLLTQAGHHETTPILSVGLRKPQPQQVMACGLSALKQPCWIDFWSPSEKSSAPHKGNDSLVSSLTDSNVSSFAGEIDGDLSFNRVFGE